jgi:hypothetical protein
MSQLPATPLLGLMQHCAATSLYLLCRFRGTAILTDLIVPVQLHRQTWPATSDELITWLFYSLMSSNNVNPDNPWPRFPRFPRFVVH